MNFIEQLQTRANATGSLVCLGLDPVLERIPKKKENAQKTIEFFLESILDACANAKCLPNMVKPNYAFFAQYGFEGLRALRTVVSRAHALGLPVILDAKRADIGKTSVAYAREVFEFWKVDAVTVAPYMGCDSVQPFVKWCEENEKGLFVLCRTSNAGASDFQSLQLADESLLFERVAQRICDWGQHAHGNVGVVVGAVSLDELARVAGFLAKQKTVVPLLIPGVGSQGGRGRQVVLALQSVGFSLENALVNSSSGILYAHENQLDVPFAKAAVNALQQLHTETKI